MKRESDQQPATPPCSPSAMHKGADYAEPCVSVQKMRTFAPNESFDRWCIKHHHWLNETPAKTIGETL